MALGQGGAVFQAAHLAVEGAMDLETFITEVFCATDDFVRRFVVRTSCANVARRRGWPTARC